MSKKPKILYYDIETSPIRVWTFHLGDQYVSHDRIVGNDIVDIISIAYCWDTGPAYALTWDKNQNSAKMIAEFDKVLEQADVTIGQNSDGFDAKHINTHRMLHGLPPLPYWAMVTDDLLKQVRKYFKLASNKLDYMSRLFGFGGKSPMEFKDWIAIKQDKCPKALAKMVKYNKKDVLDTRACFHKILPYIKPKFNQSVFHGEHVCLSCGSSKVVKNGVRMSGQVWKQRYQCSDCKGYAGLSAINKAGILK